MRLTTRRARLALAAPLLLATGLGTAAATAPAAQAAPVPAATRAAGTAWVRAAHLVPGMGVMAVTLTPFDGGRTQKIALAGSASYGAVTTYRSARAGFYAVALTRPGAPAGSAPVLSGSARLEPGKAYTVAALGTATSARLTTLADDLTPPKAGSARVRLVPAALNAPAVTVTAVGGPTLAKGAAFGQASGYATVPAGPWTLRTLPVAATRGSASSAGPAAVMDVKLRSGSVYTLFVLDGAKGALRVTPVLDAGGMARMPKGGVQLGGGWLATHDGVAGPALPGGLAAALLALALAAVALLAGAVRRPGTARGR